jgi:hypothetical protein
MTQASVTLREVGRFTDKQLIARLRDLVRADQQLGAHLLVHLGEVDARGLYREQAYPSMFAYCVKELHMSEGQAYMRIQAARLGRQFPLVVELFERGALHLSAIKLLAQTVLGARVSRAASSRCAVRQRWRSDSRQPEVSLPGAQRAVR